MIPFLLLLLFSIYSSYMIQAAPFTFKDITSSKESNKATSSSVSSKEDVYDDDEQTNNENDDFYDDLERNISFRTKLSRGMRTIKKHTALIITTLGFCIIGGMYWYKIWPFNPSLPAANSSNTTVVDQASTNSVQEPIIVQESNQEAVHVNKKEEIKTPITIPSPARKENESKNLVDKNFKEALENVSKKYEFTENAQKGCNDFQEFIDGLEKE